MHLKKSSMKKNRSILFFLVIIFSGCSSTDPPQEGQRTVEVVYLDGQAQLLRHGKPYIIKGGSGHERMEKLASYGGNSIRTWNTQNAVKILDEAASHGLTVTLGLEVGKEWWGEDFNYWNLIAINQKVDELRATVEKYKDHPALLLWGIGNEVDIFGGNRYLVYYTINRIAKMIHEIDPNHPVMTAITVGFQWDKYTYAHIFLSDVDILAYNAFERLPQTYEQVYGKTGWKRAYMFSEWGPTGHWETAYTEWGAPKELNSNEKSKMVKEYLNIIENDSSLFLGGYAFYWGNKYEITHTWFSLFSEEGYETEAVNVLKAGWSGKPVSNHAPVIKKLDIETTSYRDNFYLTADSVYQAAVYAHDPDEDSLAYKWELRHEEANFYESGKFRNNLTYLLLTSEDNHIQFKAPKEIGGYRLFAFVYDGQNHVATHNIPFYVVVK
jgi:hypothetical protein